MTKNLEIVDSIGKLAPGGLVIAFYFEPVDVRALRQGPDDPDVLNLCDESVYRVHQSRLTGHSDDKDHYALAVRSFNYRHCFQNFA